MSTAVVITGQTRTFAKVWKSQREAVFRKLDDPYFFVSVVDDENVPAIENLTMHYGPRRVFLETFEQIAWSADVVAIWKEATKHAPYQPSASVEAIAWQLHNLMRGFELFSRIAERLVPEVKFDKFVRIRPDLHFHYWTPPFGIYDNGPGVHLPWWGSYGGAPDRFAYIVGAESARAYFLTWQVVEKLLADGCAFHPETLLGRSLELAGVPVFQTMDAEFSTLRTDADLANGRQHDVPSYRARDIYRLVKSLTSGA